MPLTHSSQNIRSVNSSRISISGEALQCSGAYIILFISKCKPLQDEERQDFSTFLPSHFWPVLSFEASFERSPWSAPAISCTADSSIPRSFLRYLMHLNKHCNFHIQACKMHNNNIMSCNTGPHHISIANITLLPRTHYKASIND